MDLFSIVPSDLQYFFCRFIVSLISTMVLTLMAIKWKCVVVLHVSSCCLLKHSSRRKRAADYVIFTEDQVHILPGYPKQISQDPLLATLAFYLQFPPGSSSDIIKKDTLVSIVKGSLADISSSINGNISSVQTLFAETTPQTTSVTPTRPTEKYNSNMKNYIIVGSVVGGLLVIIVAAVIAWRCNKPRSR